MITKKEISKLMSATILGSTIGSVCALNHISVLVTLGATFVVSLLTALYIEVILE